MTLRIQAEGSQRYVEETTIELVGVGLHRIELSPESVAEDAGEDRQASTGRGGNGGGEEEQWRNRILVEIEEGDASEEIEFTDAVLSVCFVDQEGRQTAVLTLVGPGINVSRAFFGPGGAAPVQTRDGTYDMLLVSWNPVRHQVTVAFTRSER